MNIRVFIAILGGCILGGALVYALAEEALWYLIGVPLGGIAAWIIYTWREIKRETPRVWRSVSLWQPDTKRWRAKLVYLLSTMMLAAAITLNPMLVILAITGPEAIYNESFQMAMIIIYTVMLALSIPDSIDNYKERRGRRVSSEGILFVAKKKRDLIFALSPIGITIMLFGLIVYLPTIAKIVGGFLLRLFVRVHSSDAFNCFVYATLGVLVGSLLTQSIWVMAISAIAGILLALVMRMFSNLIKYWLPHLVR